METPKLNVRLLRKIQRHILKEPRRFFMSWFVARAKGKEWKLNYLIGNDLAKQVPPCKTAACIAGWANILTGAKTDKEIANPARAARQLCLPRRNYDFTYLFASGDWPDQFAYNYSTARTAKSRAKIACARIDHLIKTGE